MIIVDTTVLSLVLRRRRPEKLNPLEQGIVKTFVDLSDRGDVVLLGVIRQEVLSGVRHAEQFDRLRQILNGYKYLTMTLDDHDVAAQSFNTCRAAGIAAGDIDMLIAAAGIRRDFEIFTTDPDFAHYARCLPIRLMPIP
jgi:predicted nucleic acid-binding protein